MVFTPRIHTYCEHTEALKASKSQQLMLLPYTSQREKKNHTSHKPSKSTTIHPATPSTPSLQPPKASINQNPNPKKRRRHSAIPAFQSSSPNSSSLAFYLPCKPTKTKTPSKGPGKIAARMHMYVWYSTVVYVLFR
ncbi:hypothetical protein J3E68DRAFT_415188 [Trichoderma sp. SZMC 28012]